MCSAVALAEHSVLLPVPFVYRPKPDDSLLPRSFKGREQDVQWRALYISSGTKGGKEERGMLSGLRSQACVVYTSQTIRTMQDIRQIPLLFDERISTFGSEEVSIAVLALSLRFNLKHAVSD